MSRFFMNWPATIPSQLAEAGNGFLAPIFAFVMLGLAYYIGQHCAEVRHSYESCWSWRVVVDTYRKRKAAIAFLVGVGGVELKTSAIWLTRHLENHGVDPSTVLPSAFAPIVFIAGTLATAVGFTCWLRVTIPREMTAWTVRVGGRDAHLGRLIWPAAIAAAATWSLWMAKT